MERGGRWRTLRWRSRTTSGDTAPDPMFPNQPPIIGAISRDYQRGISPILSHLERHRVFFTMIAIAGFTAANSDTNG